MAWSKNNRACTTTWTTLTVLDQLQVIFSEAGAKKISELSFWNKAASNETRTIMAETLAVQMDNVFIKIRGAKYEDGRNQATATSDIASILKNGEKTVSELANINNDNYLFWEELK